MNLAEFRASLAQATPPTGVSPALQALWYAAKGDWDRAHEITQPGGPALDWVHAYLHRVEGDLGNAAWRATWATPPTGIVAQASLWPPDRSRKNGRRWSSPFWQRKIGHDRKADAEAPGEIERFLRSGMSVLFF
ncbi:MAG: hypothetical protein KatS3mg048_0992 [Caldilinea sp.]|nr:hypothetical protein [Caldilinea sp.]GIV68130.1 MAG: hypothetical protein KatS3mg048_0992 [Caldilinea sp.]